MEGIQRYESKGESLAQVCPHQGLITDWAYNLGPRESTLVRATSGVGGGGGSWGLRCEYVGGGGGGNGFGGDDGEG